MKNTKKQCLILSDYPIKSMGYLKLLKALGETSAITLDTPPCKNNPCIQQCKLLIVDMNWLPEDEDILTEYILEVFPKSQILFMKEDSTLQFEKTIEGRSVYFLGKLCSLEHSKACISHLLAKAKGTPQTQLKLFETA
jgi:hypothetical protein